MRMRNQIFAANLPPKFELFRTEPRTKFKGQICLDGHAISPSVPASIYSEIRPEFPGDQISQDKRFKSPLFSLASWLS